MVFRKYFIRKPDKTRSITMKSVTSILIGFSSLISAEYANIEKTLRKIYSTSKVFFISMLLFVIFLFSSCSSPNGDIAGNKSISLTESFASGARLMLRNNWQIQTSSDQPEGVTISNVFLFPLVSS